MDPVLLPVVRSVDVHAHRLWDVICDCSELVTGCLKTPLRA